METEKEKYIECEKLNDPSYKHLCDFIEFLETKGYELTRYESSNRKDAPVDVPVKFIDAIYHFLDVDKIKLEKERQQMLNSL
jgi:hypothetical protein